MEFKLTELHDDSITESVLLKEELSKLPEQKMFESGNGYLDKLIGGFMEGDMIILGGSQKSGKTLLLQTWTKQFSEQKIGCLWFSVELSNREFLNRFGGDMPVFYLPKVMPTQTTHLWIEQKILEAKKKADIKVVFIDHLGMIMDEETARSKNETGILDARLFRLKRFAIAQKVVLIVVVPFISQSLRQKKTEPATSDFRGTAMIGYTADTLLALDRLIGQKSTTTVNEVCDSPKQMFEKLLISSDAYLYILDCRRTGTRKTRIKMNLDEMGNYREV